MLRLIRRQDGRRWVEAEHPGGWCMQVPIEWTNLSIQIEPFFVEGQEVRLSANGLSKLATALCFMKSQKATSLNSTGEQAGSTGLTDVSSIETQSVVSDHAMQCDRRLGNANPQNVARKIKRHGEES